MNLTRLKEFAIEQHVPIVSDEGLSFLKETINQHQIKDVLEIGTAIGYSALAMASYGCYVDTFEKDETMIQLAEQHFDMFDLNHQIKLIPFDALSYEGELRAYDLIFIDAAKAQYKRFFEKFEPYLKKDGLLICDNLRFHDLDPSKVNRHTKQLLRKIESFKTFLKDHPLFDTEFFMLGDGMSISKRKNI